MDRNKGNEIMQINSNTPYTNVGTATQGFKPDVSRQEQRSSAPVVTREAIKPERQVSTVIDQNDRAKQIARNAYTGASQRGSLLNIVV